MDRRQQGPRCLGVFGAGRGFMRMSWPTHEARYSPDPHTRWRSEDPLRNEDSSGPTLQLTPFVYCEPWGLGGRAIDAKNAG